MMRANNTPASIPTPKAETTEPIRFFARKEPEVIRAIEYTGDNIHDLFSFLPADTVSSFVVINNQPHIRTLEGDLALHAGDFVIEGYLGELHPMRPDKFWAMYDEVPPTETSKISKAVRAARAIHVNPVQ